MVWIQSKGVVDSRGWMLDVGCWSLFKQGKIPYKRYVMLSVAKHTPHWEVITQQVKDSALFKGILPQLGWGAWPSLMNLLLAPTDRATRKAPTPRSNYIPGCQWPWVRNSFAQPRFPHVPKGCRDLAVIRSQRPHRPVQSWGRLALLITRFACRDRCEHPWSQRALIQTMDTPVSRTMSR